MAKVTDRRNQALGGQRNQRSLSSITDIGVHWSGVANGTIEGHERHWENTLDWDVGGYHYAITKDGTILWNYNLERITNGVGGHNSTSAHVMYEAGHGAPMNDAQKKSLKYVINELMKPKLPNLKRVRGHNEFPDTAKYKHSTNSCPGINMYDFRAYLKEDSVKVSTQSKPEPVKPETTKNTYKVTVDGYLGPETVKALQRYFELVVDGEMWGQYSGNQATKAFNQRAVKYGRGGSPVVKALQRKIGASPVDGIWGAGTTRALQRYLGTPVDGEIWRPSSAIKELQRRLNAGTF